MLEMSPATCWAPAPGAGAVGPRPVATPAPLPEAGKATGACLATTTPPCPATTMPPAAASAAKHRVAPSETENNARISLLTIHSRPGPTRHCPSTTRSRSEPVKTGPKSLRTGPNRTERFRTVQNRTEWYSFSRSPVSPQPHAITGVIRKQPRPNSASVRLMRATENFPLAQSANSHQPTANEVATAPVTLNRGASSATISLGVPGAALGWGDL